MNSESAASDLPVATLSGGGGQQPRVPGERYGNGATIDEIDTQRVFVGSHVEDSLARLRC